MSPQYVQHKSGQGEKWETFGEWTAELGEFWKTHVGCGQSASLPKSEYVECDPPEVWEDVTGECHVASWGRGRPQLVHNDKPIPGHGYRVRKVRTTVEPNGSTNTWAFIVERKKS